MRSTGIFIKPITVPTVYTLSPLCKTGLSSMCYTSVTQHTPLVEKRRDRERHQDWGNVGRPERHHERNSGKRVTSHTFGSGVGHRLPRGGALLPLALAPVARLRLAAPRVGVGLAGLLRQWQRLDDCVLEERHLVRVTDRVRVRVRGRVRGRVRVRVRVRVGVRVRVVEERHHRADERAERVGVAARALKVVEQRAYLLTYY